MAFPWVTSCFQNQLDWAFTMTYNDDNGDRRSALITFMPRYLNTSPTDRAREFERDLQVWIEDILRPIGPSVVTENPKPAPRSRRPRAEAQGPQCKVPLSNFQCSWSKYLEANPSVKAWADANPDLAEKEKIKVGAVD